MTAMVIAMLLAAALPASAGRVDAPLPQSQAAPAPNPPNPQDEEDAELQPAEPDYRLVNLPTTMRLPRFKGNFAITHRFAGNLRRGSLSEQASRLFGVDDGAVVGFEYRFAPVRRVQAVVYRTAFARTIQLSGKYDAVRQRASMPVSASAVVSVEGPDNLHNQHAPSIGVSVSRLFRREAAAYVVPTWVHHSAAATGVDRDTFFVGVGGRLRVRQTVYLVVEVSPRVSGYAPGPAAFGFAVEKRAGGHMFQINVTNTSASTPGQIARGGVPASLALGFNLSRKFF